MMMHTTTSLLISSSSSSSDDDDDALLKAKVEVGRSDGKVDASEEVLPSSNNGGGAAEEQCRKSEEALEKEEEEGEGGGNNNGDDDDGGLHSNKCRVLERKEEEEEEESHHHHHHHHHESSKSTSSTAISSSGGGHGHGHGHGDGDGDGNGHGDGDGDGNGHGDGDGDGDGDGHGHGHGDGHGDGDGQRRLVLYLYLSYLLCRWGDRMWDFAVGLFMIEIWKHSLFLASLYGLVETATVVVFGVTIGDWMDKFARLKVIQISLALQNMSILGASMAILVLLVQPWPTINKSFKLFGGLILAVNVLGGVSALASLATKVSLERDWVVIMAAGSPANNLTKMNAAMRRIDLSCTLLAAVFVGLLMSAVSVVTAAIFMAAWNVTCVGIEYWLLLTIYKKTPRLHERIPIYHLGLPKVEMVPPITKTTQQPLLRPDIENPTHTSCNSRTSETFRRGLSEIPQCVAALWHRLMSLPSFEGWRVYMRQQDKLAGISFSLLSLSVLSFGTLMTASLKWRGCPAYVLGLSRGLAALIGIFATVSYPFLQARLQTLKAGFVSILIQWAFLILCVVSVWLKNSTASTALLISGAGAARAGLWMFDLSVTQLMQESVPEEERGIVVGVQNTMQSFCQLLTFVVGMIIPHPKDFDKMIFMSFGSVTLAAILYAIQVYSTPVRKAIVQSRQW